jgi:hypothetical protein
VNIPPLLMIAEGRKPRARKAENATPKELDLHLWVADLLRRFARHDWRWSHFPAGEHRDVRTAAKLKAMGVQRGWPDFILFNPTGLLHALELKRAGGRLTDDQEAFEAWCVGNSVPHSVCNTLDGAIGVLSTWGALRVQIGGLR